MALHIFKSMKCKFCNESNPMMNRGKGRKAKSLCKACHTKQVGERGRKNRKEYIAYKGGKCSKCGYEKCSAALEFHHLDPSEKDPTFTGIRYWGLEKAKEELDKCILLCANCHREIHSCKLLALRS